MLPIYFTFRRTGMLNVEGPAGQKLEETRQAMRVNKLPFEELSGEEIQRRFPMLKYPKDHRGLFDPSAGMLLNDRCLAVLRVSLQSDLIPLNSAIFCRMQL
jgi:glycine/D-amino acid oxidase-like deaminating enzyme